MKYINGYCNKEDVILEYKVGSTKKIQKIEDFEWYLYIRKSDWLIKLEKKVDKLLEAGFIRKFEIEGDYVKLYTENLNNMWQSDAKQQLIKYLTMNNIEVFEADFSSLKRYCIDNDVQTDDNYSVLFFDIETDDSGDKIVIGGDRILSMAAIDKNGNTFYFSDENEQKLLGQMVECLKKYDIISGWNSKGFDLPYIKGRLKLYGMRMDWRKVAHVDMMKRFMDLFRLKKYSLNAVAEHFLGEQKVDHSGLKIIDMFNNHPEMLKEYNIQDVQLLLDLDKKTGCIDLMIKQANWCNTFMSQFWVSELLDNYILAVAKKKGIICPSKKERHTDEKYTGAIVLEPERGLYENVYVFDFSSLYPTLIQTSNIGFDTLDPNGLITNPGSGIKFLSTIDSIVKTTIDGIALKRKEFKQKKVEMIQNGTDTGTEFESVVSDELVVKALINAIYGIMGMQTARWYKLEIAESITKFGQWLIGFTKDFFDERNLMTIYGDTDSVFVTDTTGVLDNGYEEILKEYHEKLEEELRRFGIKNSYIELADDKSFETFLLIDKKNYCGIASSLNGKKTEQLYAKGLDYIKRSTIKFTARKQKELIEYVLTGKSTLEECIEFMDKTKEEVQEKKLTLEDITITTKITKPPHEYKSKSPHVLVAEILLERYGALENSEIEYVVIDKQTKTYIPVEDYKDDYDAFFYFNDRVFNPLHRILKNVYPEQDWEQYKLVRPKKPRKVAVKKPRKKKEKSFEELLNEL